MPISSIDGVLMSSRDGLRLAAFYRDRLGLPLAEERHGSAAHWACRLGGIHLVWWVINYCNKYRSAASQRACLPCPLPAHPDARRRHWSSPTRNMRIWSV